MCVAPLPVHMRAQPMRPIFVSVSVSARSVTNSISQVNVISLITSVPGAHERLRLVTWG